MTDFFHSSHGIGITSAWNLDVLRSSDTPTRDDLVLRRCEWGDPQVQQPLERRVVAEHVSGPYTFDAWATADGYLLDFSGRHRIAIGARGRSAHVATLNPDELPSVLVGSVLGFVLMMRGRLVLHASAIEHAGAAQIIVGPKGCGKSLIASLACAQGASLLTDDVCAIERSDSGVHHVLPGSTVVRLRHTRETVEHVFAGAVVGRSADGRSLMTPMPTTQPTQLARILVAVASNGDRIVVEPRDGISMIDMLMSNLRIPGLKDPEFLFGQFDRLSTLVGDVQVALLRIPAMVAADDVAGALLG